MVKFETDKLVIACYPPQAGGKFLINCLGLSDDCLLQSAELSQKQISRQLSQQDKLDYFLLKLSEVEDEWNDLDLGCHHFFSVGNDSYLENGDGLTFGSLVDEVSNSGSHYFFLVSHFAIYLRAYLSVWKNPTILRLKNTYPFINYYKRAYKHREEKMWKIWTPELESQYDERVNAVLDETSARVIEWDTAWYLDKERTLDEIKVLYEKFELSGYNRSVLSQYYDGWIGVITKLREFQV